MEGRNEWSRKSGKVRERFDGGRCCMTVIPRERRFVCLLHGNSFGENKQSLSDFKPQIYTERGLSCF